MLMAVQLPNHFVIARLLEIEIRNQPEVVETSRFTADVVLPPFDFRPGLHVKGEQAKPVTHNLIRDLPHLFCVAASTKSLGYNFGVRQGQLRSGSIQGKRGRKRQQPQIFKLLPQTETDLAGTTQNATHRTAFTVA